MTKSFQQFCTLPTIEQLELIIVEGVLLAQSKSANERSFLYQVFDFFVSVGYSEPEEELQSIQCFDSKNDVVDKFQQPMKEADPACRVQHSVEN